MYRSIIEARDALRRGEISSRELVDQALAARREELGAFISHDTERARAQAAAADAALEAGFDLGPLMGLPVSVKDLYGVPGFRTHAGTPRALPETWERPGPVVDAVRRQMGVVIGKTHTVELAFGGIGTNLHHGSPINPWDAEQPRVPGGSSSGAGVSLAEGSSLLALGTDTAGSVRIPASYTGNVGLKTTKGRWSTGGIVPLSPTLDTAGVLCRTVADAAVAFAALDPRWQQVQALDAELQRLARTPSGLRFGRCDDLMWRDCSPGVVTAVDCALGELVRAGADVRRLQIDEIAAAQEIFLAGGPVAVELSRFIDSALPSWRETLDPNVRARIDGAASLPASTFLERVEAMQRLGRGAARALERVDALVAPAVAITPPTLAEVDDADGYRRANLLSLRNTSAANYLGLCAITLPVGRDSVGMPVGLMLMAPGGCEERLLAVARVIERQLGTAEARLGKPSRL